MKSYPGEYSDVHKFILTAGPPLFLNKTPSARSALAVSSNSASGLTSLRLSNSLYFITNLHKDTKYINTQKSHAETITHVKQMHSVGGEHCNLPLTRRNKVGLEELKSSGSITVHLKKLPKSIKSNEQVIFLKQYLLS